MNKTLLTWCAAGGLSLAAVAEAVVWDDALIVGHTNGGKCFYEPGEEMVFTLRLEGVKGELPAGAYFIDWNRWANDGKTERGRVPASLADPLVIRTKLDIPGFVKIEANVVDRSGKKVPRKHKWEKRVFFQGGAGVRPEQLQAEPEPADFDAFWRGELKKDADLPLEVLERSELPCANPKLRLWRMKLNAPDGVLPATGYLVIPKGASVTNRVKATGRLSGYYCYPETCPEWLTNHVGGIEMYINRHGCELDRDEDYYRPFYTKDQGLPAQYKGMSLRAFRMFRFLKTLPEWNGRDLEACGSSGGAMQSIWMGALVPGLTRVDARVPACGDVFGFRAGRAKPSIIKPVPENAYYDICNLAKRVKCPVVLDAGLGDYVCPPTGLAIVYNNIRTQKKITWHQGCTHGWWPKGMATTTFSVDGAKLLDRGCCGGEELTPGARGDRDPLTGLGPAAGHPLAGVIRWDCWAGKDGVRGGEQTRVLEQTLAPEKYRWRLPWFAEVKEDGSVAIDGARPGVMEQEIDYAADAGLDYFIFLNYGINSHKTDALDRFRLAKNASRMQYAICFMFYKVDIPDEIWPQTVAKYISCLEDGNYVRVCGDRPLVYTMHIGGEELNSRVRELKSAAAARGLNPYFVYLNNTPDEMWPKMKELGYDAYGMYATAKGLASGPCTYGDFATNMEDRVQGVALRKGHPCVPCCQTGWQKDPRKDYVPYWEKGLAYHSQPGFPAVATPDEIADSIRRVRDFVRTHPEICPANTFTVYAWNEHDEGGWLCPTWTPSGMPDTSRVDALRKANRAILDESAGRRLTAQKQERESK